MKASSFENKMSTVRQCFLYFCTFSPYQRNKTNNFKIDHVVFGLEVSIHQIKKKVVRVLQEHSRFLYFHFKVKKKKSGKRKRKMPKKSREE